MTPSSIFTAYDALLSESIEDKCEILRLHTKLVNAAIEISSLKRAIEIYEKHIGPLPRPAPAFEPAPRENPIDQALQH